MQQLGVINHLFCLGGERSTRGKQASLLTYCGQVKGIW